jgi:proteic killer suppression protein
LEARRAFAACFQSHIISRHTSLDRGSMARYDNLVIESFADQGTKDIFNLRETRKARKKLPMELMRIAHIKLLGLHAADTLRELETPPSNRLESLQGDRKSQYSLRINRQYRICFTWSEGNANDVEIVDYH